MTKFFFRFPAFSILNLKLAGIISKEPQKKKKKKKKKRTDVYVAVAVVVAYYINNSLHLARKYDRIFVRGH